MSFVNFSRVGEEVVFFKEERQNVHPSHYGCPVHGGVVALRDKDILLIKGSVALEVFPEFLVLVQEVRDLIDAGTTPHQTEEITTSWPYFSWAHFFTNYYFSSALQPISCFLSWP